MATPSFRDTLTSAVSHISVNAQNLWTWLAEKLDLTQSRPQAAAGIVISRLNGREGTYYILKNPAATTYFRLSEKDYFLWQQMDGSHTVKDMVVAYFMEYKVLAFGRVGILLEGLKSKSFLIEQPVNVYQQIRTQLEHRNLQARLASLGKAFIEKQFPIHGVDRVLTTLYKRGGWMFYTRPAQILWLLLTAAGLICFSMVMTGSNYGIITVGGSYLLGVISLIFAYLFSIFIHEMAHALTVKHYGREVPRGGLMIYFGLPAFFVDTSDIWMEGKRPRLAVTWAGPYSDLILAGLASLVLILWPGFFLNPLLFQFAFVTYLSVLLNLNPLLELDGYFLLMDGLEIPMLRRKSLEFIRRGIWAKFKAIRESGKKIQDWFREFSREERIFAVFGFLAAIWTVYTIVEVVDIWQRHAASVVSSLFVHSGPVGRIAVSVGLAVVGLTLLVGLGFILVNLARQVLAWATRRGLFATPWRKSVWVMGLILLSGSISFWYPILIPFIGLEALTLAVYFAACNARDYRGSRFATVFWLMSVTCLAFWLSEIAGVVGGMLFMRVDWMTPVAAWLTGLASLTLVSAGLVLFWGTDFRSIPPMEKLILNLGYLATLALMIWVITEQIATGVSTAAVGLAVLGTLSLPTIVFLFPTLTAFWRTSTGPAAATIGLGLAALLGARLLGIPSLWAYLLLAGGFGLQQAAFKRRVVWHATQAGIDFQQSDHERLKQTFAWTAGGLIEQMLESGGRRQADIFVGKFNEFAQAANWHIQIVRDNVDDGLLSSLSLRQLGITYAAALNLLLELMARHMGERLAVRALQRVYDALPWEVREIAALYLFPDVKWAQALGRQFQATQQTFRFLLQRIPIFASLSQDEIDHLCSRLQTERYTAGQAIIRQGDRGDRFYIVTNGSVEVEQRSLQGVSEIVNHLGQGDYFGQVALLNDSPRNATCRATVPTEVLSLSRKDFDQLVKICFDMRGKVENSMTRINLLRQIPIFADIDGRQLQLIVSQLREESCKPGALVIRQGEIGQTFYVIESGRVQVVVEMEGGECVVNELGTGEYFGEIALLLQSPRNATVRAAVTTRLLVLDKSNFDRLVVPQLYASRLLEQEMSRRIIQLRRAGQN